MKNIFVFIVILILFQSCKEENKNAVYRLEPKPGDVILYGNTGIKNKTARDLFETGLKMAEKQDYAKAKELFLNANQIEKNNVEILNCIANSESALGNNQKAIQILYSIIPLDSTDINTYTNLGQHLMQERNYKEANSIFLKGLKLNNSASKHSKSVLLSNLAISCNNIGECSNGLKYSNEALKISQSSKLTRFINQIIKDSEKGMKTGNCR